MYSFEVKPNKVRLLLDGEPVTKWCASRYAALRRYAKELKGREHG